MWQWFSGQADSHKKKDKKKKDKKKDKKSQHKVHTNAGRKRKQDVESSYIDLRNQLIAATNKQLNSTGLSPNVRARLESELAQIGATTTLLEEQEEEDEEEEQEQQEEEQEENVIYDKEELKAQALKFELTDLEVEIYMNRFLCGFTSTYLGLLYKAYWTDAKVDCTWPLYDKHFYTNHITSEYVGTEVDLFFSQNTTTITAREWPKELKRLYYALYDAIRLCHYDTILEMKINNWAIYDTLLRKWKFEARGEGIAFANGYKITQKVFDDNRIKDKLKVALPGLLAKMVLTHAMESSAKRTPRTKIAQGPYMGIDSPDDIDTTELFAPTETYKELYDYMKDTFNRQLRSNALGEGYELYECLPIYTGGIQYLKPTYLSGYYLCCDKFSPLKVSHAAGVKINTVDHSTEDFAVGKYSIISMILNEIDPAENTTFPALMKKTIKGYSHPYNHSRVERTVNSTLAFRDKEMDVLLTNTNIDELPSWVCDDDDEMEY